MLKEQFEFEKLAQKREETKKTEEAFGQKPEGKLEKEEIASKERKELNGEKEEISPEILRKAEDFDKTTVEAISRQLKSGELTPEKANEILNWMNGLIPEQKAEAMEKLTEEKEREKMMIPEELRERQKTREDFQESISKYEETIDDLDGRAKASGIEVSLNQLKSVLERFRSIDSDRDRDEEREWLEYFGEQLKDLSERIGMLEKNEEKGRIISAGDREGNIASEKGKEQEKTEEDLVKLIEKMTSKSIEYLMKLTWRITVGILKGVAGAFSKGKLEGSGEK